MSTASSTPIDMFRPPVNRAMRVLDRSCFQKRVPLSAAKVYDKTKIAKLRSELGHDVLRLERFQCVQPIRGTKGEEHKALLLDPRIKPNDTSTWSPKLSELVKSSQVEITPYDLELDYDYWNYSDIMDAILPEEEQDDYPTGFSIVGHVAHLNLRTDYLPYKHLIAQVLMDKNHVVRTVINKTDEVGEQNEYRTFSYELLAGEDDMNVEVHEENCTFRFDYSKVYWNTRLNTEHRRLVDKFKPGEAVCDVMAGVGPFAVPAGKKNVFVWANDLNPDSYVSLKDAIERNKVQPFVHAFNEDGHAFIRNSLTYLSQTTIRVPITPRSRHHRTRSPPPNNKPPPQKFLTPPKAFTHYILNLPATALTFLPAFISLYHNSPSQQQQQQQDSTSFPLPLIHVYCFSTKSDDNSEEAIKICKEISTQLGFEMRPGKLELGEEGEVEIWNVRDVAPKKTMFCATFRLPREVAFRKVEVGDVGNGGERS